MTIASIVLMLSHLTYGGHIRLPYSYILPTQPSRLLLQSAKLRARSLRGLNMTVDFIARISPHLPYGGLLTPPHPLLVPMLSIRQSSPLPESAGLRSGPLRWPTMTMMWGRVHIHSFAHLRMLLALMYTPETLPYTVLFIRF